MGLFAVSLFAWTEAARGRRRAIYLPLLAVAVAASMWTHYYAAFTVAVLGLGEVVRQVSQRRIDWPMWIAFGAAILLTLPLLPLLRVATEQSAYFWAQAERTSLREAYGFLLPELIAWLFSIWGAIVVGVLVVYVARAGWRWRRATGTRTGSASGSPSWVMPVHEIVAFTGAALIPAVMWLVAYVADRPFSPRYTLPAVVGVALCVPLALRWARPRGSIAELILCAALVLSLGKMVAESITARSAKPANPVEQRPMLAATLSSHGRVVASGSLTFLQLWYYAPPMQRMRLLYIADPAIARHFTGSDTFDRGYLALSKWTAVPVEEYGPFVSRTAEFTVYALGSGWLLEKLREDGATVQLVGTEPGGRLYRVSH